VTCGFFDGKIRIWEAQNGEELFNFKSLSEAIFDVVWLADDRLATTGGENDDTIRFWDGATGVELFEVQQYVPVSVDLSPDGQKLCVGGVGGMILDARTGVVLAFLSGHSDRIKYVAWSPDGNRIATASFDLTARIWDVSTGKEIERLPLLHYKPLADGLAWSPDGKRVLIPGYRGIREWDLTPPAPRLLGHTGNVNDAQFSPDGRLLLAGGESDASIHIWEVSSGKEVRTIETTEAGMYEFTWSPDSSRVIVSSGDRIARMWDVRSGELLFEFDLPEGYYYSFGWSPDGSRIVAAGNRPVIPSDLLDANTGERILTMEWPEGCIVLRPSWSPDGNRIVASCTETNHTYIWEAGSGKIVQTLEGPAEERTWIAYWSPDGTRIAVGYMSGLAQVWEVATGQVVASFAGHSDIVQDLAWSPDSRRIVSGGDDYTVKIWDASSGEELFTYPTSDFVLTVDWSSSGEYVVAAKFHDPVPLVLRAWQSTEELIAYTRECCVWRELTEEERKQFGLTER
jgi:WD40 repeat protein